MLKRTLSRALWPFAKLVVVTAVLIACHQSKPEAQRAPVPVRLITVQRDSLASDEIYAGEVVPRTEAQLAFLVPGRVEKRLVEVGDHVSAGQVLVRLETRDYEIAATSARALLEQSRAETEQNAIDLKRTVKLYGTGALAKAALDESETNARSSQARFDYASSAVDRSARDLTNTALRSPTDGVVVAVTVENGQVISQGQPIVRIASAQTAEVAIDVPEAIIHDVAVGSPATVKLWADSVESYQARVREIAPESDASSRTYHVKLTLDQPDDKVHFGMSARVSFGEVSSAITVPLSAIFETDGHASVWVFDESKGHVIARPVVVDRYIDGNAILKSGLSGGERIASAGAHRLDPGMDVVAWGGLP